MKTITFDISFDRLIGNEGEYSDGKGDPGGETKWGISKRSYPRVDIRNLTREGAKDIYRRDFWDALKADTLPGSVMYQLFDFAVNSGIPTAVRYFQRVIGVADDGYWGPISIEAAKKISEDDMLILLNAERLDFMTRCSNWKIAGKGWARRIANQLRFAASDNVDII